MRTRDELNSTEFNDDMSELEHELKARKIPYTIHRHKGADSIVKDLIGYYPTGEWQIIIRKKYSVIRGMCSFGYYEIMNIEGGNNFAEPERFKTAESLCKQLEHTNE